MRLDCLGQQGSGIVESQQVIGGILGDQALQVDRGLIHLLRLPAGQQEGRVHRDRIGVLRVFLQQGVHQLIRLHAASGGRVQLDQALLIHRFVLRKRGHSGFVLLFRQLDIRAAGRVEIARQQMPAGELLFIGQPRMTASMSARRFTRT